jgi:ribosomal protein S18 acetylase RimI-like enzyme
MIAADVMPDAKHTTGSIDFELSEESLTSLAEHANVSIAFEIDRVFDVVRQVGHSDSFLLSERRLAVPYLKDYDSLEGESPAGWANRFDVSKWGFIVARVGHRRVGGVVIAFDTPGVRMLEGRSDIAAIWDIRVSPEFRGKGIGAALFAAAEELARLRNCREIRVETQNTNVAACRFYQRQQCVLKEANSRAYSKFPDEIEMIWSKQLTKS